MQHQDHGRLARALVHVVHAQGAQSAVGELEVMRLERKAGKADEATLRGPEDFRVRHGQNNR